MSEIGKAIKIKDSYRLAKSRDPKQLVSEVGSSS